VNNEPAARVMIGEVNGRLVQIETYLFEGFSAEVFHGYKGAIEYKIKQNFKERNLFPGAQLKFVYLNHRNGINFGLTDSVRQIAGIQGRVIELMEMNQSAGDYLVRAGRSYTLALVTSIITSAVATLILPPYGLGLTLGVLGAGGIISTVAFISGNEYLVKAGEGLMLQSSGTP